MHEKQKNDSIERRINREPNIFRMFAKKLTVLLIQK